MWICKLKVHKKLSEEDNLSAPPPTLSALPRIPENIPENIIKQIDSLGKRTNDKDKISNIILQLCSHKTMKSKAIAAALGKSEKYIFREFLKPLLEEKK
jgi:ATP-dependent DNA helicase RecG